MEKAKHYRQRGLYAGNAEMESEEGRIIDRTVDYTFAAEARQDKIATFLRGQRYSRQMIAALQWSPGSVERNGVPARMEDRLAGGDHLRIYARESRDPSGILPVNLPLSVAYEDEDLVVVNKPAGMPVQPSWYYPDCALANAAAWYYRDAGSPFVYRCITRLDKDTTGLVLLAKNGISAGIFAFMMQHRKIRRTYFALTGGVWRKPSGTIDLPIQKRMDAPNVYRVDPVCGKRAVTHYQVIGQKEGISLVRLQLETGRTHQIRVHMQAVGHPILGDPVYGTGEMTCNVGEMNCGTGEITCRAGEMNCGTGEITCGVGEMNCGTEESTSRKGETNYRAGEISGETGEITNQTGEVSYADSLCLHAGELEFLHPITGRHLLLRVPAPFADGFPMQ